MQSVACFPLAHLLLCFLTLQNNHRVIAQMLLDAGANTNAQNVRTPALSSTPAPGLALLRGLILSVSPSPCICGDFLYAAFLC